MLFYGMILNAGVTFEMLVRKAGVYVFTANENEMREGRVTFENEIRQGE